MEVSRNSTVAEATDGAVMLESAAPAASPAGWMDKSVAWLVGNDDSEMEPSLVGRDSLDSSAAAAEEIEPESTPEWCLVFGGSAADV
eukprot:COSAG05_NODE_12399_length_469_cov_1.594595_1_plen_86_part_10